jgi:hypothetical protein
MPIDTICPKCQAKLRIGDEYAGQQARCPRCDTIYAVPTLEEAVALTSIASAESPPPAGSASDPPSEPPTAAAPEQPAPPESPAPAETLLPPQIELPPADGTQWFLRTPEGPIYGPTRRDDFQRWVVEGRVTPDCFICPGDNTWKPASEIFPELAAPRPKAALKPETIAALKRQPHRGALILILGIMGILTTCPIPSIMAWVMGTHDLDEMRANRMDDSGYNMTASGRMLGLIFGMMYVAGTVIGTLVLFAIASR